MQIVAGSVIDAFARTWIGPTSAASAAASRLFVSPGDPLAGGNMSDPVDLQGGFNSPDLLMGAAVTSDGATLVAGYLQVREERKEREERAHACCSMLVIISICIV